MGYHQTIVFYGPHLLTKESDYGRFCRDTILRQQSLAFALSLSLIHIVSLWMAANEYHSIKQLDTLLLSRLIHSNNLCFT